MKVHFVLVVIAFAVFTITCRARPQEGINQTHVIVTVAGGYAGSLAGSLSAQMGGPYSAVRETESVQTLSDGTHITRKSRSRFYRDSLGRTREERFWNDETQDIPDQITIEDPVENLRFDLTPRDHTGTRNKIVVPVDPQPLPKPAVTVPAPPPPQKHEAQNQFEDLGMAMIEGVWAHGTRQTITYPVGSDGNDRPIVAINENWFSDDLQTIVLSKRTDLRYGDYTNRVINIDRSEPDPALFRPPADYTITDSSR